MGTKYYVVSIQLFKEGEGTDAQNIFAYEDEKTAKSNFHSTLASNYANDKLKGFSCMVINDICGVLDTEYWQYVEPAPEPNTDSEE